MWKRVGCARLPNATIFILSSTTFLKQKFLIDSLTTFKWNMYFKLNIKKILVRTEYKNSRLCSPGCDNPKVFSYMLRLPEKKWIAAWWLNAWNYDWSIDACALYKQIMICKKKNIARSTSAQNREVINIPVHNSIIHHNIYHIAQNMIDQYFILWKLSKLDRR